MLCLLVHNYNIYEDLTTHKLMLYCSTLQSVWKENTLGILNLFKTVISL